jgi:hypothetical protein
MEQTMLFPSANAAPAAKPGDCGKCGVALVAVGSYGGGTAAWQCPSCHAASISRMPPLPKGATVCPVCLKTFTSVRRHWAQQFGKDRCRKHYEAGMIWSKDRPAWASHSEQSNG